MFQKWVKPGFAVEYCRADESSTLDTAVAKKKCTIATYSILFCGTEKCPFALPITVIVMNGDDSATNISEIIYVANGAITIFFDTVEMVRRQNAE